MSKASEKQHEKYSLVHDNSTLLLLVYESSPCVINEVLETKTKRVTGVHVYRDEIHHDMISHTKA